MERDPDLFISESRSDVEQTPQNKSNRTAFLKGQGKVESPAAFFNTGGYRLAIENPRNLQEDLNNESTANFNDKMEPGNNNPADGGKLFTREPPSPLSPFKLWTPRSKEINENNTQDRKPFYSPLQDFFSKFSPQSKLFSQANNSASKDYEAYIFGQSPGIFSSTKFDAFDRSPLLSRRCDQKLDFTSAKLLSGSTGEEIDEDKSKKDENELYSQKSSDNLKSEPSFGFKVGSSSPNFKRLQKSIYGAAKPLPVKASNNPIPRPVSKITEENTTINPHSLPDKKHFQQGPKAQRLNFDQDEAESPKGPKIINFDTMTAGSNKNYLSGGNSLRFNEIQTKTSVSSSIEDKDEMTSQATTEKSSKKKLSCNCKKSKCLKLYCDCFAVEGYCGRDCNCADCYNNLSHQKERQNAINTALERNPYAFKPKIQKDELIAEVGKGVKHNKGCNCKKSGCLKKYCECFAAGIKCSDTCKCGTCMNVDPPENQKKIQKTTPKTLTSNEASLMPQEEDEDEKQEEYTGEFQKKKLKVDTRQINAFNSVNQASNSSRDSSNEVLSGDKSKRPSSKINKNLSFPNQFFHDPTLKEQV